MVQWCWRRRFPFSQLPHRTDGRHQVPATRRRGTALALVLSARLLRDNGVPRTPQVWPERRVAAKRKRDDRLARRDGGMRHRLPAALRPPLRLHLRVAHASRLLVVPGKYSKLYA